MRLLPALGHIPAIGGLQPERAHGGGFLVHLIWRRWVTPVRPLLALEMDDEGYAEHKDYLGSLLDVEAGARGETVLMPCTKSPVRIAATGPWLSTFPSRLANEGRDSAS